MSKTIPMKEVNRNSVDGRFVTDRYLQQHPRTTEREHVPVSNPRSRPTMPKASRRMGRIAGKTLRSKRARLGCKSLAGHVLGERRRSHKRARNAVRQSTTHPASISAGLFFGTFLAFPRSLFPRFLFEHCFLRHAEHLAHGVVEPLELSLAGNMRCR